MPIPITPLQPLISALARDRGVNLYIKRDDRIHPTRSGNKFYKLIANIHRAKSDKCSHLLSFGGGFSNHLYALAAAGAEEGMNTVGIVRGDYSRNLTPTLRDCRRFGMTLRFVDRKEWRLRHNPEYLQCLSSQFANTWIIPEGGDNHEGYLGTRQMGKTLAEQIMGVCQGRVHVLLAAATGTTMAGVVSGLTKSCTVHGVSVLKGRDTLTPKVASMLDLWAGDVACEWRIDTRFHQGGYARAPEQLMQFIRFFERKFSIPLDPVYTAKVMFAVFSMLAKNEFRFGDSVVVVHTGGLQGRRGFSQLMPLGC